MGCVLEENMKKNNSRTNLRQRIAGLLRTVGFTTLLDTNVACWRRKMIREYKLDKNTTWRECIDVCNEDEVNDLHNILNNYKMDL